MKCNVAIWDRIIRFLIGTIMLFYAIAGGPFWCYLGIYFLFTSAWGICFIYGVLKIQTTKSHLSEFYKPPQG